jgi:hypothetical protein
MIGSRLATDAELAATIMPPFAVLAKAATARSISAGYRTSIGRRSTPTDGATDWTAANCPMPTAWVGSRRTATRVTPGATSLSSSSRLPAKMYSDVRKPVALPPGCADIAGANGIKGKHEYERNGAGRPQQLGQTVRPDRENDVGRKSDQFRREFADAVSIAASPSLVELNIVTIALAQLLEPLIKRREVGPCQIDFGYAHKYADASNSLTLLRAHRERRPHYHTTDKSDELPSSHPRSFAPRSPSLTYPGPGCLGTRSPVALRPRECLLLCWF